MLAFLIYLYTLPIRIQFDEVFIGQLQPFFFFFNHRAHAPWCVFLSNKLLHNSHAVDLGRIHGVSPNYFLHCARSCRCKRYSCFKNWLRRASLVAQWLGICLPMQWTRVRALVWEDPTCRRATGPMSPNC